MYSICTCILGAKYGETGRLFHTYGLYVLYCAHEFIFIALTDTYFHNSLVSSNIKYLFRTVLDTVHYGFFSVSTERWCRLRGNLLFYFKSRDHWSEPAGVIVLENCQVTLDHSAETSFAFNLGKLYKKQI